MSKVENLSDAASAVRCKRPSLTAVATDFAHCLHIENTDSKNPTWPQMENQKYLKYAIGKISVGKILLYFSVSQTFLPADPLDFEKPQQFPRPKRHVY
jgi:hypothetical protein